MTAPAIRFAELVDIDQFRTLMQSFFDATGIPHGLVDTEGNLLSMAGWQDICTAYHRVAPGTNAKCEECDHYLESHLHEGPYVGFHCGNGMMDYGVPVIIEGRHLATFFLCQLLHEPPDVEYFREQARRNDFDEDAYLKALRQVPVVPVERVAPIMAFFVETARMLGNNGLARLREKEAERALQDMNDRLSHLVQDRTEELREKNERLLQEVAEHSLAEQLLREQKEFLNTIVDNEPECVKVVSQDGMLLQINRAGLSMLEADSVEEVNRCGLVNFVLPEFRDAFLGLHQRVFEGGSGILEFQIAGGHGARRWLETHATPLRNDGGMIVALISVTRDVTERRALLSKLEHQARTDYLTGLANRRRFLELAGIELARTRRYGGALSMLMLDIDRFKEVNDTRGHQVGDAVLRRLSDECRKLLREVDIVGRMGGEEFAILLPETDEEEAVQVAERIRQTVMLAGVQLSPEAGLLYFTVSIGVTALRQETADIDALLKDADDALYAAKRQGRNRVCRSAG